MSAIPLSPEGPHAAALPDGLRASDEERFASAERLAAHAAAGRLSVEELEQRVAAAHSALFTRELAALEADLPDLAVAPAPRARRRRSTAAASAAVVALAVAVSVLVGHPVAPPFALAFLLWRAGHRVRRPRLLTERGAA